MSEKQPASVPRAAKRIGVGARGATVVTTQDERRRADGLGHAGRRAALGRRAAEHELQAGAMHELTHDRPPRPEGGVAVRSREEDRPRRSEERRAALCREWCQRWHAAATRRWWRMAYTFDGGRVVTVRPAPTPVPELSAWDETGREGKFSSALGRLCWPQASPPSRTPAMWTGSDTMAPLDTAGQWYASSAARTTTERRSSPPGRQGGRSPTPPAPRL